MVRRRGAARTSAPRRRTYRTKVKWDPRVIPRRFKIYIPKMTEELDFELEILLLLEEDVYPYLEAQGIPTDQWEYYIAFARRMWERRVHFNDATFQKEKQSLLNEFEWRGLNPTYLAVIQGYAETRADQKIRGWCWREDWSYGPPGTFYKCWGEVWGFEPPPWLVLCWEESWSS